MSYAAPNQLLLVEDNPADAHLMLSLFEQEGFNGVLHWVKNGEEALDFVYRRGNFEAAPVPDLILLDLNLPRAQGHDVLRIVRQDAKLNSVRIIVLTTSSDQADMLSIYRLRASGFFTKPRELDDYEALVRRIINVDVPLTLRMG